MLTENRILLECGVMHGIFIGGRISIEKGT